MKKTENKADRVGIVSLRGKNLVKSDASKKIIDKCSVDTS